MIRLHPRRPLFERHPRRYRRHLFDDLPMEMRHEVQQRHWQMRQEYKEKHGSVPAYAEPILIGRARAITVAGPGERSRIGRRMLAARGGHALQRQLREAGLGGGDHPHCKKAREAKARKAKLRADSSNVQPTQFDSIVIGSQIVSFEKPRSKWLLV